MRRPRPKPVIDYGPIRDEAEALMDEYASDDFHEDRLGKLENNIVESALEAIYGPSVFEWINNILK